MRSLEQRYRRLLAWYPREHREMYEQEMLGVLLDAAGPTRTRPTVRETASLLAGATGYRLRLAGAEFTGGHWRRTASVLAAAAPAVMLVATLYEFVGTAWPGYSGDRPAFGPSVWVPPVAWALVTVAALAGPRLLAAGLGWLAFLFQVAVQVVGYERQGLGLRPAIWTLVVSLVAALALSHGVRARGAGTRGLGVAGTGARDGLRLLGWRRVAVLAAIGLVSVGRPGLAWVAGDLPSWSGILLWGATPRIVTLLACGLVLVRLDPPVRRRLLAVFAALTGLAVLEGFAANRYVGGGYLVLLQALAVVAVTVAGFGLAVAAIRWRERRDLAAS